MKYTSFATLAALFAVVTITASHTGVAAAKVEHVSAPAAVVAKAPPAQSTELYAQAGSFNDRTVRLDAQPVSTSMPADAQAAKSSQEAPMNLLALIVAGFAVMGSLAFRRSPNK